MKEKQKIHYSVWKRFVDGIYTCKDIEELLADKKTDRSKDFDEASACLWKTGEEESSSSWEEWISNERQALQIISNYEDRRRSQSIYLVKKWGSIAAAVLLCIVLSVVYFANPADMKVAQYEIHVPYGKRQKVVLPDGTKVILNAGSYMKYPRQFGKEDRYVHFKGEAYFDVKKDTRPFVVSLESGDVTVLGTSFGVSAYPGYPNYTTLVRGSVRFTSLRQEQVVLTPGEQAVVNISGTLEKRNVDVEEFVGWKDGVFIFKDKTLAEIMQILERWYGVNVIFQDESLKELEYTGSLERYDSINTFLQLLEKLKEIRYEIKKNTIVLFK